MKRAVLLLAAVLLLSGCGQKRLDDASAYPTGLVLEGTSPQLSALTEATETTAPNVVPNRNFDTQPTDTAAAPSDVPTAETAAAVGTGQKIVITKHPYSETVEVGGSTTFVARADYADAMNWIFTAPDGKTYSLSQLPLPGLKAQALSGDTLSLQSIPMEMNGWKLQAKFENDSDTVLTEPATVTVEDHSGSYSRVISYYRTLRSKDFDSPEIKAFADLGIIENEELRLDLGGTKFFYFLLDLDNDGVEELFFTIGANADEVRADKAVYAIFTLENGKPVQLFSGWSRKLAYLLDDGALLIYGSSGAGNSEYGRYYLVDGSLYLKEAIIARQDADGTQSYAVCSASDYPTGTPIAKDSFDDEADILRKCTIDLPKLTTIS